MEFRRKINIEQETNKNDLDELMMNWTKNEAKKATSRKPKNEYRRIYNKLKRTIGKKIKKDLSELNETWAKKKITQSKGLWPTLGKHNKWRRWKRQKKLM